MTPAPDAPDLVDPVVQRALSSLDAGDLRECPSPSEAYERLASHIETAARFSGRYHRQVDRARPTGWFPRRRTALIGAAVLGATVVATRWIGPGAGADTSHAHHAQYITRVGQRATITLADGSRIRLAPQTILRVAPGFATGARHLTLQGEAFIDVSHTSAQPFIVHTATATTRVLGTAFSVRQYNADIATHVSVVSGRVSVTSSVSSRSAIVEAGMEGIAGDSTAIVRDGTAAHTTWTGDRLIFRAVPTADVLMALTHWYGYTFQLTDSMLARQPVTLGISTQSSAEALATLGRILEVDVVVKGSIVTMKPKAPTRSIAPARREPSSRILSHTEVGR
jgi:ferric-dicitrate binding protein FerR (iron transport regulator)